MNFTVLTGEFVHPFRAPSMTLMFNSVVKLSGEILCNILLGDKMPKKVERISYYITM